MKANKNLQTSVEIENVFLYKLNVEIGICASLVLLLVCSTRTTAVTSHLTIRTQAYMLFLLRAGSRLLGGKEQMQRFLYVGVYIQRDHARCYKNLF